MAGKVNSAGLKSLQVACLAYVISSILIVVYGLGIIVSVYATFKARESFRMLRKNNNSFSTPAKLEFVTLLASILGIVLIMVAILAPIIWSMLSMTSVVSGQADQPSNVFATPPLNLYNILNLTETGIFVSGITLFIVAIISGLLGLSLGFWRLGNVYKSSKFQLFAVLFWIPIVNWIALCLSYFDIGKIIGNKSVNIVKK